ncbi:MAG: DNRLRE domain-containing protein [Verrucomicrobiota bacterium]
MTRVACLLRAGLLAAAFSSSLLAGTASTTLNKDVMAKEKFPTTNFGADVNLQASAQATFSKIIYLQFTVSGIPAGATGVTAQLKLRSSTTGTGRPVAAHALNNTAWTETGLTWTNKPGHVAAALSTVSSHTSGSDSVWNVSGHVNNNGTFALALDTTFSGDTTFSSREGANDPVLTVTYTDPTAYSVYRGSTHAHTIHTYSHGAHLKPDDTLYPDWPTRQGPPSEHYSRAKTAGYDFYVTTDHSQEADFNPTSATNAAWVSTKNAAAAATDGSFVALAGYEHSENNGDSQGPNPGNGHINVINPNSYLDALESPVDLPHLYNWLTNTVQPNGTGLPVVASFNHPGDSQYNNWAYRASYPGVENIITLFEIINSNAYSTQREGAFRIANNAGWKVSPTAGNDNHGFSGITSQASRVGVLATARTKAAILDGMKNRRTFCSTDVNMTLRYDANGVVMGSTLGSPSTITFVVTASDPDTGDSGDRITLIEVVDPSGTVVANSGTLSTHSIVWTSPAVSVSGKKYFYVRARNGGSGSTPMSCAAPIWTGL